jgi:hypothetical protein
MNEEYYIYPRVKYKFYTIYRTDIGANHIIDLQSSVRLFDKITDKWYFKTIRKQIEFSESNDPKVIADAVAEIHMQFHHEVYLMRLFGTRLNANYTNEIFKIEEPFDEDQSSEEDRMKELLSFRFK